MQTESITTDRPDAHGPMFDRLQRILAPLPALSDLPSSFDPAAGGDHALNPGAPSLIRPGLLTPAAVLVPVIRHRAGPSVLLTRRTDTLAKHSGQVAFPGGRLDDTDADLAQCALRETEEEVGLARDRVGVIGALSPYITVTGYVVTPVVGIVEPGFDLVPNPAEVADVFEVPLAFLLDDRNHKRHGGSFNGTRREWWAIPYGAHYIWGATAGMLRDLLRRWNDAG
jgi:8-oxo-dGTP pyrophosphatase MutT (NUDIX family)